jgi:hypothetical protein
MLPPKQIAGFLLRCVLLYGIMAAPWPTVQRAYSAAYAGVANAVFGSFGSDGVVRFQRPASSDRPAALDLVINRRGAPQVGRAPHDPILSGYLAAVEVIALILATPVSWARRFKSLLWGMLLIHAFVWLRLELTILFWFSGDSPLALYDPGPFWFKLLASAFELISVSPTSTFVVPIFIWILVSFRKSDFETWRKQGGKSAKNNRRQKTSSISAAGLLS